MKDDIKIHLVTKEELPALIDWFAVNYYDNRKDAEDHFVEHIDGKSATFLARHNDVRNILAKKDTAHFQLYGI